VNERPGSLRTNFGKVALDRAPEPEPELAAITRSTDADTADVDLPSPVAGTVRGLASRNRAHPRDAHGTAWCYPRHQPGYSWTVESIVGVIQDGPDSP
jgi:hypothetical protein